MKWPRGRLGHTLPTSVTGFPVTWMRLQTRSTRPAMPSCTGGWACNEWFLHHPKSQDTPIDLRCLRDTVDPLGPKGKSGHGRTVDMSRQLAGVLRHLYVERKAETLRRGWPDVPPWVFCSETGTP